MSSSPPVAIAIVRARYNPFGGAERFVQRALAALSAQQLRVSVIARRWNTGEGQPAGIEFVRVDPFYLGSLWRDWSFARGVQRFLRTQHFAIVQSHERIAGLPVYRAGDGVHAEFLAQRARVLSPLARFRLSLDPYHRYLLRTERRMFTHPALRAVICNSSMVINEIRERFGVDPARLHLIRNGVDLARFQPPDEAQRLTARAQFGVPAQTPLFAYVGSGFERKGLASAIRALAEPSLPAGARLLVIGTDRHARRYRQLADSLGVGGRVLMHGGLEDVRPALWAADAFVLPTLYDPFPNAALEALACGLPLVTSPKSGAAEVVREGGNGYVRDALDSAGIAQALAAVLSASPTGEMRAAARQSVMGFSLEAMASELIALYRRLIESARP